MIKISVIAVFLLLATLVSAGNEDGVIILEGKYQNKNIYIAQALGAQGFGFCAFEVRINGELITDEINSDAFEIDLEPFNFSVGDDIIIEIKHKKGCTPKVLNPGGLKPKPTFETLDINIDESQVLQWITEKEYGALPYIIQQYKWNKWVDVGSVQGEGAPTVSNYAFHVDFTSGENRFRVIQKDGKGKMKKSPSITIESKLPELVYNYNKKNKQLIFSNETGFEIHDKYGDLVMKGYGSSVDLSNLAKDDYWLSYDNKTTELKTK